MEAAADGRSIVEKRQPGDNAHLSGSLGLGLWLAKSLVQVHGGDIDVARIEGKGATFSVRLPLIEEKIARVDGAQLKAHRSHYRPGHGQEAAGPPSASHGIV